MFPLIIHAEASEAGLYQLFVAVRCFLQVCVSFIKEANGHTNKCVQHSVGGALTGGVQAGLASRQT